MDARLLRARMRRSVVALVAACVVLVLQRPASAACHFAAFEASSQSRTVGENAGQVQLTVELVGGQPTCAGTVDYQTFNGTAASGQDYTARQGTLTFTTGDDRKESFTVPILEDAADEPSQTFTVRLSNGTGDITASDTPATVTITDNDPAPQQSAPATASQKPRSTPSASASARGSPSASASASHSPSPTQSPTTAQSATPTPSPTLEAAPAGDTGGGGAAVAAVVAALVLAAGGAGYWFWRRRPTG